MSTAVALHNEATSGAALEQVIIRGNLSDLSAQQRVMYYRAVCDSVGLNALTQPFAYITLNGKLTLYALRNATDQLRQIHKISVSEMTEAHHEGVYVVTCKVYNPAGRTDMAKGAVNVGGLKGEALANAMMKAETKAKRRATLSICGLSLLDETEVEDIPAVAKRENPHVNRPEDFVEVPAQGDPDRLPDGNPTIKALPKKNARADFEIFQRELNATKTIAELEDWGKHQADRLQTYPEDWREIARGLYVQHKASLGAKWEAQEAADQKRLLAEDAAAAAADEPPTDPDLWDIWANNELSFTHDEAAFNAKWDYVIEPTVPEGHGERAANLYAKHAKRLGVG